MSKKIFFVICICVLLPVVSGCDEAVNLVECELTKHTLSNRDMQSLPVYIKTSQGCEVGTRNESDKYFSDDNCTQVVSYKYESFDKYCSTKLLRNQGEIGKPSNWSESSLDSQPLTQGYTETKWALSWGSNVKLYSVDQTKFHMPYVKEVAYNYLSETGKSCRLSMRVYKKNVVDTDLQPVIYIHGGGWRYRGFMPLTADMVAPLVTGRNRIMFSLYYPLTGNHGPEDCQNFSGSDIQESIKQSLSLILNIGKNYGMTESRPDVVFFGQSAGAQLVLRSAMQNLSNDKLKIQAVFNMYGPTDFSLLIEGLGDQRFGDRTKGVNFLKGYVGESISDEGLLDKDIVTNNSYATDLHKLLTDTKKSNDVATKFYTVHGNTDAVVPVEGAYWLCNAERGQMPDAAGTAPVTQFSYASGEHKCGDNGSSMLVINNGNHGLDLACKKLGKILEKLVTKLTHKSAEELDEMICPSGNSASTQEIANYLTKKLNDELGSPP